MNDLERQLDYPLGERLPPLGEALDVAPGVRWVRMGLPFQLDHINLWLLRDRLDGREGWTVVDCGIADDSTRGAWERLFAEALDGLPVLRVVVTHMHPDHIGLADWLTRRWSTPEQPCRLWISATDYHVAQLARSINTGVGGEVAARFMASHGLSDPQALERIRGRRNYYVTMVPAVPERFQRLRDGSVLQVGGHAWQAIAGYGHAPEHIALHAPSLGLLISGDMVLPRISTNVSVIDVEPEADPLRDYLDSLDAMRVLPTDTLVLPSHGRPFRGLHTRIDQLHAHHDERLRDLMQACAEAPRTAADILPVLFRRPLDLHQTAFAMGESIAHLNLLWRAGRLRRISDDGVHRFVPA
ncbi:MBL fold metallo-hydrolase [Piscinibacter sakaiensis]|nr:MBL fold metallo-hydrolase [Piscinibacter sakaiensis]